ncbi:hypothetical protein Leryth_027358 [Lithospermum erythrorhizon]|nr:hypothetical protein Leryth_027358 [Lithospermum erythrorhizon]
MESQWLQYLAFVIIAILITACFSKKQGESGVIAKPQKKEKSKNKLGASVSQNGNNRLTFIQGSELAFDLEDLLSASAEVLGKGTFGTTYKAALEEANNTVAVKIERNNDCWKSLGN